MTIWKAFLRIDSHLLKDVAPDADALWLGSRGIEEAAPIVLHHLRRDVLPLVRRLKPAQFWFAVHNRESGVPTAEDDKGAYIDLTMVFRGKCAELTKRKQNTVTFTKVRGGPFSPWTMLKSIPTLGKDLPSGWKGVKFDAIHKLFHQQAELVLSFIEAHPTDFDNFEMLKQLRQFLHGFANAAQMRIS